MDANKLLDLESSDDAFKEYIANKPEKKKIFVSTFDNIFENDNWENKNTQNENTINELEQNTTPLTHDQKRALFIGNIGNIASAESM